MTTETKPQGQIRSEPDAQERSSYGKIFKYISGQARLVHNNKSPYYTLDLTDLQNNERMRLDVFQRDDHTDQVTQARMWGWPAFAEPVLRNPTIVHLTVWQVCAPGISSQTEFLYSSSTKMVEITTRKFDTQTGQRVSDYLHLQLSRSNYRLSEPGCEAEYSEQSSVADIFAAFDLATNFPPADKEPVEPNDNQVVRIIHTPPPFVPAQ